MLQIPLSDVIMTRALDIMKTAMGIDRPSKVGHTLYVAQSGA